ncbi:MAG: TIGR01841 family phasin [Acetobacteraceae bacterium]|nr:TIGR01841 family phasin [Acetobacteraceae bacterium]
MAGETDDKAGGTNKLTEQTAQNAQRGAQAVQEMGRKAQEAGQQASQKAVEAGRQTMDQLNRATQDVTKRTADAGMAGMAEFSRMFGEMKFPMMPDMEMFLSAHRRNMETLSAANRVALEGAQTVAKRHMEIVQQTMQEMTDTIRQLSSSESPQARASRQAELVKQAYERAVAHMRELADLIQRSNGEALGMLNQRFTEAMDEVKAMAQKSGQS